MRISKRLSKLFVSVLTVIMLLTAMPGLSVFAGSGYQPPPTVGGGGTGSGGGGGGSGGGGGGNNFWYLTPHKGDITNLQLDIYVVHTKKGKVESVTNTRSKGWPYPHAYSLGASKGVLTGTNTSKIKKAFNWGSNHGYLTIISKDYKISDKYDWKQYAAELNKWVEANYPGTKSNYTADDLIKAVDNYLKKSYDPGWGGEGYKPNKNRAVDGHINYPGTKQRLGYIDLKGIAFSQGPTPAPKPKDSQTETESKWLLTGLSGNTYGTTYNPDTNLLDGYDAIQNFSYNDSKSNGVTNLATAWNGVPDLTYTRTMNYSVVSQTDPKATYICVERRRTREAIYEPIYYDAPYENIVKEWKQTGWTEWTPWAYSITDTKTVTATANVQHDRYEPDYAVYNWMQLTPETWTKDTSLLVSAPGIYPEDYKEATKFTNTNLNFVLNSNKSPGEIFTVLSDNNPKVLGLNFSYVFGADVPTEWPTTLGGVWCAGSKLNFGPVQTPASQPLVSVQRTSPSPGADEVTGYSYYVWPGVSPLDTQFKIRSILYGSYTLGDGRGSNYWYTYMKMAAYNKLGSSYTVTAPGVLDNAPSSSTINISKTVLENDIGLTHTFIQPVLMGDIETKDVAGT